MIVKYVWVKIKETSVYSWRYKLEKWEGWFLFGLIPIYAQCIDAGYFRNDPT